jgi:hypothetical protein
VARYASGGTTLEPTGVTVDAATNVGIRTATPAVSLHIVKEPGGLQPIVRLENYGNSSTGPLYDSYHARGDQAAPLALVDNDVMGHVRGWGYTRNAGDTALEFTRLAELRLMVDGLDAQGRGGGRVNVWTSAGVGAAPVNVLSITSKGNVGLHSIQSDANLSGTGATRTLVLGPGVAPSTSPTDTVQMTAVDRGGTAGKRSLQLRSEDGTTHVLGDLSGIATTLSASLGSGASYQALNENGSTLYVGQSSVQERPMALVATQWVISTDASRQARLTLSAYDLNAVREGLRIEGDYSNARLGFFGSSAVAKPTVTGSRGGNAALASALTALASLGLITDSSST